jgi:hypothetical protein
MKKRSLTIVVLVIIAVIITVIVVDFMNNRPDRRGENPYALEVDEFRNVDPALISHKETRNLSLGGMKAAAMAFYDGRLFIAGDSSLVVILPDGTALARYDILPGPTALAVAQDGVFIGYRSFVARYDRSGTLLDTWQDLGDSAVITNLVCKDQKVYVADAGHREVLIFSREGALTGRFEGKAETEAGHGFIVPSANFDLAVDCYGELWVVNPGKHALENYTDDGRMRGYWEKRPSVTDGFQGCCNPARITTMEDGSFVTSEKGYVKIRIFDPSGEQVSVVAAPDLFKEEGKAPDVCADGKVVYALDYDRNMVRIFEPKENG